MTERLLTIPSDFSSGFIHYFDDGLPPSHLRCCKINICTAQCCLL